MDRIPNRAISRKKSSKRKRKHKRKNRSAKLPNVHAFESLLRNENGIDIDNYTIRSSKRAYRQLTKYKLSGRVNLKHVVKYGYDATSGLKFKQGEKAFIFDDFLYIFQTVYPKSYFKKKKKKEKTQQESNMNTIHAVNLPRPHLKLRQCSPLGINTNEALNEMSQNSNNNTIQGNPDTYLFDQTINDNKGSFNMIITIHAIERYTQRVIGSNSNYLCGVESIESNIKKDVKGGIIGYPIKRAPKSTFKVFSKTNRIIYVCKVCN